MQDDDTTAFYRMRLPYWEIRRAVYFVTMHVKGSLPAHVLEDIKLAAQDFGRFETIEARYRYLFRAMEDALDAHQDVDCLVNPRVRRNLHGSLLFAGTNGSVAVHEYVLMPNHVHFLIQITRGNLKMAIESYKRWTTLQARPILGLNRSLWQQDWFDHWPRSNSQFEKIREYIRNNPVKAGLVKNYHEWPYASWNDVRRSESKD